MRTRLIKNIKEWNRWLEVYTSLEGIYPDTYPCIVIWTPEDYELIYQEDFNVSDRTNKV